MSLINDALKRASEAAPPPPPVSGQDMEIAGESPSSKLPLVLIPVLLLFVVALAVWFFAKGLEVARQVYRSSETPIHAREVTPAAESDPLAPTVEAKTVETIHSATTTPGQTPLVPPLPEKTNGFPVLKLQALFYRADVPTAVINTKQVGIGSRINGATVLSITREGVQVVWQGEARELTLP